MASTKLVAFDSPAGLPAFLQADAGQGNLAVLVGSGGYPVISIKGKVFTLTEDGEKTLITKPDAPDEPAASLEVVILDIGPRGRESARIYYHAGYEEGSTEKPDCYSDDGIAPAADARGPQSNKCATCAMNVKGSGATANNPQGKACSSAKRMAIATPDNLGKPILLRVPGASIVPLSEHLTVLKNRGVPNSFGVVTKIGFDYSVAYPALTFKPVAFVTAEQYAEAMEVSKLEIVNNIIGASPAKAPAIPAPVEEAPAAPAKAKAAEPAKPKTVIKVEGDDEPATPAEKPAPKKAAPKPAPEPVTMPTDEGLDAALDDLDFDD